MKALKLFIFLYLIVMVTPVVAHSKLIASEPANEAELSEAPQQIMLEFNREVRLVKLALLNENEESVELDFKPVMEKKTVIEVVLPELKPGAYQVKWIAMSGDSHKMKGEFSFTLMASEKEAASSKSTTSASGDEAKSLLKEGKSPCGQKAGDKAKT